jgi:cellulose synthase/poly-beta-1,6-N-acetylglucosamine synthase-like glycosyltransferase
MPGLLSALKNVQSAGVALCVHGWAHEDFALMSASEAKQAVQKGMNVFSEAGLIPVAFIPPYQDFDTLPPSVRNAIQSTGIATSLPVLKTNGSTSGEYGWMWRTMTSFSDSRFNNTLQQMELQKPAIIMTHIEDWNIFLKQLITDYLNSEQVRSANIVNVTIRVDDVEVNTPVETVYDIASLYNLSSVGLIAYAVIPAGTWRGGDPAIFGISVNQIFNVYWMFFVVSAFFPFSFLIIWRGTSRKGKWFRRGKPPSDESPDLRDPPKVQKVSIVVPAYNEEENISRCIQAVMNQDFNGEKEIIIVNDGSTDKTGSVASLYPVKLLDLQRNSGKAQALNRGLRNATGDIVIFSDADSEISKNAVSSLTRCLEENPDVAAACGTVYVKNGDGKHSLLRNFQEIEYHLEQEVTRQLQSIDGKVLVCPGPLFAVRRNVADEIGFSNATVVEDADFTICILKKSMKVIKAPDASVITDVPKSVRPWLKQRKRWWYGNLQLWKLHDYWAKRNPWMMLNYVSYPASVISIAMLIILPYLFSMYNNMELILLRGMLYLIAPWVLFVIFAIPLFLGRNKRLILMLIPYYLVYGTLKLLLLAYLYLRYKTGIGIKIMFGPREIRVK